MQLALISKLVKRRLNYPLTSTSNTTSRTASPAFIGGIGASVNSPKLVLSRIAISKQILLGL